MPGIIAKTTNYLRAHGLAATVRQIRRYLAYHLMFKPARARFLRSLSGRSSAEIFTQVHSQKLWGCDESLSGPGSSLAYTANIRTHLPIIIKRFGIQTILDAPCGDFYWMRAVALPAGVTYIGGDIVRALVERNHKMYSDPVHRFQLIDIRVDSLPPGADLMMCRDCLLHLSFRDILAVFENFARSGIPFLLTSTHLEKDGSSIEKDGSTIENRDIATGDARPINLFAPPFCLPPDVLYRVEDYVPPGAPREMCLWRRDQVLSAIAGMSARMGISG